jgi:phage gp16-like protein
MSAATALQIGAIHTIAKRIGLDQESRRDVIASAAGGKRSARDLTVTEAGRVIERLKELQGGAAAPAAKGARVLDGDYAPKLRALWISGWNLGVVQDRSDAALLAFLERQTGLSHTRFLRDAADGRKVIEALKAWLAREAGVDWPTDRRASAWASKAAVYHAQSRRLEAAGGPAELVRMPAEAFRTESRLDFEIRERGDRLRRLLKGA